MKTFFYCFLVFTCSAVATAQERPTAATTCDLALFPEQYDKKVVRVSGTVSLAFEDFSLHDDSGCRSNVWLTFGGRGGTPTIYCCGIADQTRPDDLVIESIKIPLVTDATYHSFYGHLTAQVGRFPSGAPCYDCYRFRIRATLTGRFFRKSGPYEGYGHFGMFHLLAIQQVDHFNAEPTKYALNDISCSTSPLKIPSLVRGWFPSSYDLVDELASALGEKDGGYGRIFDDSGDQEEEGKRFFHAWISNDGRRAYRIGMVSALDLSSNETRFQISKIVRTNCDLVRRKSPFSMGR